MWREIRPIRLCAILDNNPAPTDLPDEAHKRKDKVRSAWISFASRILAQLVGAAATIVLGVAIIEGRPPASAQTAAALIVPVAHVTRVVPVASAGVASVAVLPLDDRSPGAGSDHFADAMTDALTAALAGSHRLRVISRTTAARYRAGGRTLPEIARELHVDAVVAGAVMRAGERVRVTAEVVDGATDEQLWAKSYDRDARDPLAVQAELARAFASSVEEAVARWSLPADRRAGQAARPGAALRPCT